MRRTKKMPKQGQFVAIWEYNGVLWSGVYKYIEDVIYRYNPYADEFEQLGYSFEAYAENNVYFIN